MGTSVWRRVHDDDGFTLIELMVVVLIISILIAMALPTLVGARTRAQNRAAQSDLRHALVAAKIIFSDGSSYACATAANGTVAPCVGVGLPSVEGSLTYNTAASAVGSTVVSVMTTPTGTDWAAARMSTSGTCYAIKDNATAGTRYVTAIGTCTGDAAAAASGATSWS